MSTNENSDGNDNADGRKSRTVHRIVTMHDLTPKENGGYMMSGDTEAEVEVNAAGVRIRERGNRSAWRFLPWSEVWISGTAEK